MRVHVLDPDDEGAVAVVVALLLTVAMILGAFALDIGNAYANARQLSVAADAASLAAAAKVGERYTAAFPNASCSAANLTAIDATKIAQDEADRVNTANSRTGTSEPVATVTVTCEDSTKAIQVAIRNNRVVRTALAAVIGVDSIKPNSYAVARYRKSTVGGGLRPWAVCNDVVTAARANQGTTYWTALGNWSTKEGSGICGTSAPGNWGSVDFDGGGNPAGDLADWTRYGYPGPVTIPNPALPADPGVTNASGVRAALEYLVGKVVLFPSVSGISGNGQNAVFDAVGVATVKVCGIHYAGNTYKVGSDCWKDPVPPSTSSSQQVDVLPAKVTTGSINDNSTSLTLAANVFTGLPTGPDIAYEAVVTVAGAGGSKKTPATLTSSLSFSSPLPATVVTLADKATNKVTNAAVTVTITRTTTTTTTTPGFGLFDDKGKLQDLIEFRWVNYTTSYAGPGATICQLSNSLCVGTTVLWK